MRSQFLNKKANIIDIILSPLFVTIVALGIVLVILLSAIYDIGTSTEFKKQRDATDVGLLMDSIYAVRPDVNMEVNYGLPKSPKFGFKIEGTEVIVYEDKEEDGKYFWFSQDPLYDFTGGNFPKGKSEMLSFYKIGHSVGVVDSKAKLDLVKPYCEKFSDNYNLKIETAAFNNLDSPVDVISGDATIKAQLSTGTSTIKIFVSNNPKSAELACIFLQSLTEKIQVQGFAILPLSPVLLKDTDPLKELVASANPAFFVEVTLPFLDAQAKSQVFEGFSKGVSYAS